MKYNLLNYVGLMINHPQIRMQFQCVNIKMYSNDKCTKRTLEGLVFEMAKS